MARRAVPLALALCLLAAPVAEGNRFSNLRKSKGGKAAKGGSAPPPEQRPPKPSGPWTPPDATHKYCIVGAGPAGVQLGEFLYEEKLDYVMIDKASQVGSFFATLPVHRGLISINKKHTRAGEGSATSDFALRHDWNSLLDGGSHVAPFQERSADYWPHADDVSDYLQDFGQRQVDGGKVLLEHEVTRVSPVPDGADTPARYVLEVTNNATAATQRLACEVLVMSHGLGVPHKPTNTYQRLNEFGTCRFWLTYTSHFGPAFGLTFARTWLVFRSDRLRGARTVELEGVYRQADPHPGQRQRRLRDRG